MAKRSYDFLGLGADAALSKMFQTTEHPEIVLFSDVLTKINRKDKAQDRVIAVTDKAFYNLTVTHKLKRRIDLRAIEGITVSQLSDEFVVHVPSEYDYRLQALRKAAAIEAIANARFLSSKTIMPIYLSSAFHLGDVTITRISSSSKRSLAGSSRPDLLAVAKLLASARVKLHPLAGGDTDDAEEQRRLEYANAQRCSLNSAFNRLEALCLGAATGDDVKVAEALRPILQAESGPLLARKLSVSAIKVECSRSLPIGPAILSSDRAAAVERDDLLQMVDAPALHRRYSASSKSTIALAEVSPVSDMLMTSLPVMSRKAFVPSPAASAKEAADKLKLDFYKNTRPKLRSSGSFTTRKRSGDVSYQQNPMMGGYVVAHKAAEVKKTIRTSDNRTEKTLLPSESEDEADMDALQELPMKSVGKFVAMNASTRAYNFCRPPEGAASTTYSNRRHGSGRRGQRSKKRFPSTASTSSASSASSMRSRRQVPSKPAKPHVTPIMGGEMEMHSPREDLGMPEATTAMAEVRDADKRPTSTIDSFITRASDSSPALEAFELLRMLGKGSYGKVVLVRKKDSGEVLAMKVLRKKTIVAKQQVEHTQAERAILESMDHPFLIKLRYAFQTSASLFLVMPYLPGGELFQRLRAYRVLPEEWVQFYAAEIALGVGHLHECGIIFRDLKPENVLLDADGHVVLSDFGLSKILDSPDDRTATFCGTPEYIAPEVLDGKPYSFAVDWYSFGLLIWELLAGAPPFTNVTNTLADLYDAIRLGPPPFPRHFSPAAKALLSGLLEANPSMRLGCRPGDGGVEAVKAHPFFMGIGWDQVLNRSVVPPWKPQLASAADTSSFDPEFTTMPLGAADQAALGTSHGSHVSGRSAASAASLPNFEGFSFGSVGMLGQSYGSDGATLSTTPA